MAGSGVNQTRGGKTIIAKFVRCDVKVQLMRSKKKLKSCDAYTKVFVDEDLTPLRSKMLRELKKDSSVKSAWTIDGRIFCKQIVSGKEETRVNDSPDDLWKVG